MTSQQLLLDRLEFPTIKIESLPIKVTRDKNFPQIDFDLSSLTFLTRSVLDYPEKELEDPRHFALRYGLKLDHNSNEGHALPYALEVEAIGYFRYVGDGDAFKGADRFRAVRLSGYQILYGAIREMVCNLTGRSSHGLMQLPARTFHSVAKQRAEQDEVSRQERLANRSKRLEKKTEKPKAGSAKAGKTKVKRRANES